MTAILLVDDDRAQLDIRGEAFRQAGHRVAVAATAEEAVAAFQADPSAVVLMDLHLPTVEDGCSLIRRLHEVSPSARIVLLSGFPGNFRHLPEAALVRQVLQKPVRSERLLGILRKMAVLVVLAVLPRAMPAQVQSFRVPARSNGGGRGASRNHCAGTRTHRGLAGRKVRGSRAADSRRIGSARTSGGGPAYDSPVEAGSRHSDGAAERPLYGGGADPVCPAGHHRPFQRRPAARLLRRTGRRPRTVHAV
jgi:CheY-like chemotaxis protein